MDGRKKWVRDSLQFRLSLWLSLAIASVAILAGLFAFNSAFEEAHELQDDVLRRVVTTFDRHHLSERQEGDHGRDSDGDGDSRVFVQLLPATSSGNSGGDAALPVALTRGLVDGLQTVGAGRDQYRVLVRTLNTGQRVAVGQETEFRNEIARDSALRTVIPLFVLLPLLVFLVTVLVRRGFKPVTDLSRDIDQRGEQELHPISLESLPAEIRSFVTALNRLLGRVDQSMVTQRRFVADAAHELRSPLTALSLQAEQLADAEKSASAKDRLQSLRQGIERGRSLLDQLLTLARAQSAVRTPT